ncbi:hypothetical protein [Shewanella fidelis]|uniref:Uncharacterized protein n=1 Tax=Shewanella fidelis TaxID=173509 RepID=A0AAW8NNI5_9GAMM|nr:hypothetical protein [Shewanella fidelis]MDR8523449.1 hypothetical protein [Shewanella fidelis]MDW4813317.1 hypothetical protein [Shewanella fidelis]MDW4817311.1 hypothetical protein [Shewanella fidelis]MDW4821332.1 hypothetical protein [Shewanella fidelis]MDW4824590.1 hypothetical protein [Shewanella fidelis]
MNSPVQHLFDENQASLDRVAFRLRIAALLEANFETLRCELSKMALSKPHYCLLISAALMNELKGLSPEFAGEKRRLIGFFIIRSLKNIDPSTLQES